MMNRKAAGGFAGRGLLGDAPGVGTVAGGSSNMEPMSLGMKRMTGGILRNAPQQQLLKSERRGFMNEQNHQRYPGEQVQPQRERMERPVMSRRMMAELGIEEPSGLASQDYKVQQSEYYQEDQAGYEEPAQEDFGEPQYRQRMEKPAILQYDETVQNPMMLDEQAVGYIEEDPRGGHYEEPAVRRGLLRDHSAMVRDDQQVRRGPVQEHLHSIPARNEQQAIRRPVNQRPGLMARNTQMVNPNTQMANRNTQLANLNTQIDRNTQLANQNKQMANRITQLANHNAQIAKGKPQMANRNKQMAAREDLQRRTSNMEGNTRFSGIKERQVELFEKAQMQMRMLEEEQQKEELLKREMMERVQQQEAAQQQQLMIQAQLQQQQFQQQQLQQQQFQQQVRMMNDGLLGSGPPMLMQPGRRGMGGAAGEIPSLFEIPTRQQKTGAGLGKRSGQSAGGQRFNDNKRARYGPPENHTRPGQQDKRSRRDAPNNNRAEGRRVSRFDSNYAPRPRDRKDSGSKRSADRALERSGPVESPSKVIPKETINQATKDTKVVSKNAKAVSKDTKVKEECVKEEPAIKNKKDATGNTTSVTVTMGDLEDKYDPADPTGDIKVETEKPAGEKTPVNVETDTASETKQEGDDQPMEISLTVTVNKKGRSVNDSDKAGESKSPKREKKYKCNVCSIDCWDEESFSRHMNGMKHRKRMELVMMSSTKGAALLNVRKQAEQHLRQIESQRRGPKGKATAPVGKALETHCKICDKKFTGSFKDHKEDPDHKRTWPECKLCNQRFKSPRKFVLHCKTDHHMKNKENNKSIQDGQDDMEELVTLDTIGFEEDIADETGEDTETEVTGCEEPEDKEGKKVTLLAHLTSTPNPQHGAAFLKETMDSPILAEVPSDHDPEIAVGQQFVVAVTGFFCKLCHKFYNNETTARSQHCKSQGHFNKYKKMMATRAQRHREEIVKSPETESDKLDMDINEASQDSGSNHSPGNDGMPETTDSQTNGNKQDESQAGKHSVKEESQIEASAYETADEHKDSTLNSTADQEDVTLDEVDKTCDENVAESEESEKNAEGSSKGSGTPQKAVRGRRQIARRGRRN